MKKLRAQIFIFDMIVSFVILLLAVALIFNYYLNTEENLDVYDLNMEILNGFINTKINDLNDQEIRLLFVSGKIKNIENTVAQQVSEFYYYGNKDLAKNLTRIFVEDYSEKQLNLNMTIQHENKTWPEEQIFFSGRNNIGIDESLVVASSSRVIFGFNSTDYYGPYIFKIKIWK
jgi:hypothetical protein